MLWCIQSNIIKLRPFGKGGMEKRNGTRLFYGDAKVYIIAAYAGMCERVIIIGHHRKSVGLICAVIKVSFLENFRAKPIYNPIVASKARKYIDRNPCGVLNIIDDKERALSLAEELPYWIELYG